MGIRNRSVGRVRTIGRASRSGRLWAVILLIALSGSWPVAAAEVETVSLMVGRSIVVDTGSPITRVSLTSDDVADALVTSSAQLLVHGKTPGTISMFVWDRAGAIRRYDVTVARDLSRLTTQVRDLFPGERISVEGNGRSIVVAGIVSSKFIAEKAVEVAAGYVAKKEDVVNLLQVQEGAPDQVLLQVRFAEVTRSAITELGSNFFTGAGGYKDIVARTTTGQNSGPDFNNEKLVFSDFLNLFLFDAKHQLGTIIKAMQSRGQFQSLAEPNLVSESGKEASFLAGGEFPVPIAQGSANNASISVSYKEFGVRLNFTPIVRGTRVHLKVRPEVSTLDFANGVLLQGFRIPALATRRTETELELEDGQTFAIAGLLNNQMNTTLRKIPGIGDIPILGLLFQSKAAQKEQTELVVMITPHILPRGSSGVTGTLPRIPEPFLAPIKKTIDPPPPAFPFVPRRGADGTAVPAPPTTPVTPPVTAQPTRPTPAAAAAAVSALTPQGPIVAPTPAPVAAAIVTPPSKPAVQSKPAAEAKPDDKKLDRARRDEARATGEQAKRATEAQAKSDRAAAKQAAKQAVIQAQVDAREKKQKDVATHEQARRDGEAAVKAAQDGARQAEKDKKQQKAINEAAARLSAADAAYQAEMAKKSKP